MRAALLLAIITTVVFLVTVGVALGEIIEALRAAQWGIAP